MNIIDKINCINIYNPIKIIKPQIKQKLCNKIKLKNINISNYIDLFG